MDEPQGQAPTAAPETPESLNLPPLADTPIESLDKYFEGDESAIKLGAQPETQKPPEPQAPESTQPAGEQPQPTDTEPDETGVPKRIRPATFFDDAEREALALRIELRKTDPSATLKDAYDVLEQRQSKLQTQLPPAEPEPDHLAERRTELEKLQAEHDDDPDFTTAEYKDRQKKIRELDREILKEEVRQEQRTDQQRAEEALQFSAARKASIEEAAETFPDAKDGRTRLGKRITELISKLKSSGSPVLVDPSAPMQVATLAANELAREDAKSKGIPFREAMTSYLGAGQPIPAAPEQQGPTPKVQPAGGELSQAQPKVSTPQDLLNSPQGFDPAALDDAYEQMYGRGRPKMIIGL